MFVLADDILLAFNSHFSLEKTSPLQWVKDFLGKSPYVQWEGKIACNDQGRVLGRVAKTFTSWESQCTSDDYSTPGHVFLKVYYYHHGMHIFPATFWLLSTLPGSDDCAFQRFSQGPDKNDKDKPEYYFFPCTLSSLL